MTKHSTEYACMQESFINAIDRVLDEFFEKRYELVLDIKELYMQGRLKNTEDIFRHLKLSGVDLELLAAEWNGRLGGDANMKQMAAGCLFESARHLAEDLDEMCRTDSFAGGWGLVINQSVFLMIDHCCGGSLSGNLFQQCDYAGRLLNHYSSKKQQQKHGAILEEQLTGLLINLKTDLRNRLVRTVLLENKSIDTEYEASSAA